MKMRKVLLSGGAGGSHGSILSTDHPLCQLSARLRLSTTTLAELQAGKLGRSGSARQARMKILNP